MKVRKDLLALIMLCICTAPASAQLTAGSTGLFVKAGGHLHVAGLELKPSADLALNDLSLTLSASPINSPTGNSIARVYQFSAPFEFTGLARIYYQASELNGNQATELTLTYKSNDTGQFMNASDGLISNGNTVENLFNATPLYTLTSIDKNTVLPLKLLRLSATAEAASARIEWTTTNERALWGYRIMRAPDGQHFSLLANVPAKLNNGINTYLVLDKSPLSGTNYYQLLEIDQQGNSHYLGINAVNFRWDDRNFTVYPNPGTGPFMLHSGAYIGPKLEVQLFDVQGKLVSKSILYISPGVQNHALNLPSHLASGIYHLKISDAQIQHNLKLVVK